MDAKEVNRKKVRYNIFLKNYSETPILTESDQCRYLIYKTTDQYFIRDTCEKRVFIYTISTGDRVDYKFEK